jgi:hypothetical protein
MATSKQITQQTLKAMQDALANPIPWVNNKIQADNTRVATLDYESVYGGVTPKVVNPSKVIEEVYIPARDKAVPSGSKGAKILITAQAQFEGYKPRTKSFRTNNPGNIGNTDLGGTRGFNSLEDGILAQYNHIVKIIRGEERNYVLNTRKKAPSVTDVATNIVYPGIDFVYEGKLKQYLQIYATGARKDNNYLNFIIGYFKKNGYTITGDTTLQEIYNLS